MIRNKFGILVPETPVMRELYPRLPGQTPVGVETPPPPPPPVLQTYDPAGVGYNPGASIILEQAGYGTYVDESDKTKGWYLTAEQAVAITAIGEMLFKGQQTVRDNNGICGSVANHNFTTFDEFVHFVGVESIEAYAFTDCRLLTSILLPENVTSMGSSVFRGAIALTSMTFPPRLTYIPDRVMYGNGNGFTLNIPASVTAIGEIAFGNCYISTLTCYATTPPSLNNAFQSAVIDHIYVPAESVAAYKAASGWSTYASVIEAIAS